MGSESEVIFGVDGGITSTVCACMPLLSFFDIHNLSDTLPILDHALAGCSNFNSVREDVARETLKKVIGEALFDAGVKTVKCSSNLFGFIRCEPFKGSGKKMKLAENDAVAALASGTMGKLHGCVLIDGTGSIAYGFTKNVRKARATGACPVLGDWGSGYGIAAQALTAVMRAHDGRGPQTILSSCILQSLGLSSLDELIGWTYADPSWARYAALVPVVVYCAENGDQVVDEILHNAVQELALSVKAVVKRLHLAGEDGKGSFPVIMVGGILGANKK